MHTDFDQGRPGRDLELLRQARAAIQEGHRARARALLRQVTATDPLNEVAWLWLGHIAEAWEDQVAALDNVLAINPNNAKARERLEQLQQTRPAPAPLKRLAPRTPPPAAASLDRARELIKAGRREEAQKMLLEFVQQDELNAQAWWLLNDLVPDIRDKIVALENILTLNPQDEKAKTRLAQLRRMQQEPLALAAMYEERGEADLAIEAYLAALHDMRIPEDRRRINLQLEALQHRQRQPKLKATAPTLQVARLAAGPLSLFGLLVLIQSGLNPLHLSLPDIAGVLIVAAGSLALVVTSVRPFHPLWLVVFRDPPRDEERIVCWGLGLAGLLMVLVPLALLMMSAWERLGAYQPSAH
jgi:tetratricopeptide (TPR) repeat protein